MTLPESLTSIGDNAFFDCSKCLEIAIPKNVTQIGESAFKYCDSILSVTLPEGLKEVKTGTFASCASLKRVIMYPSVEKIGYSAFVGFNLRNFSYLGTEEQWNSIVIEAKNYDLTDAPRNYCAAISEVEPLIIYGFAGESVDWALNYDAKEITLSGEGSAGEYEFRPNGLESSAKWGKYSVITETVVVEEGITDLGVLSFYNFASLKEVRLPASLESIGLNVFLGCTALSDVYYTGSETVRDNVLTIDQTNESVLNAQWHYSVSSLKAGDINGDEKVNAMDVAIIKRIIVNKVSSDDFPGTADMNSDGKINAMDVLLLKKLVLGIS
ncbi:MAG: leucine-rich repeat protein [Clostridia bacterium]|nr:leucine-rich repeat protein [Clostridia bacterium]